MRRHPDRSPRRLSTRARRGAPGPRRRSPDPAGVSGRSWSRATAARASRCRHRGCAGALARSAAFRRGRAPARSSRRRPRSARCRRRGRPRWRVRSSEGLLPSSRMPRRSGRRVSVDHRRRDGELLELLEGREPGRDGRLGTSARRPALVGRRHANAGRPPHSARVVRSLKDRRRPQSIAVDGGTRRPRPPGGGWRARGVKRCASSWSWTRTNRRRAPLPWPPGRRSAGTRGRWQAT